MKSTALMRAAWAVAFEIAVACHIGPAAAQTADTPIPPPVTAPAEKTPQQLELEAIVSLRQQELALIEADAKIRAQQYPIAAVTTKSGNATVAAGNAPMALQLAELAASKAAEAVAKNINEKLNSSRVILISSLSEMPNVAQVAVIAQEHHVLGEALQHELEEARKLTPTQAGEGQDAFTAVLAAQALLSQSTKLMEYFKSDVSVTTQAGILSDGEPVLVEIASNLNVDELILPGFIQPGRSALFDELAIKRSTRDTLESVVADRLVPMAKRATDDKKESEAAIVRERIESATAAIKTYDAWWAARTTRDANGYSAIDRALTYAGLSSIVVPSENGSFAERERTLLLKVNLSSSTGSHLTKQFVWSDARVVLIGGVTLRYLVTDMDGRVVSAGSVRAECRSGFKAKVEIAKEPIATPNCILVE